jgi:hypothetical protein
MFINSKVNLKTIYFLTKVIDIIVKPIEWYYSDKKMVKIINKRIKAWEDYKTNR